MGDYDQRTPVNYKFVVAEAAVEPPPLCLTEYFCVLIFRLHAASVGK